MFLLIIIVLQAANNNTQPRFSEAQQCPPGKIYDPIDNVCIVPSGGNNLPGKLPENPTVKSQETPPENPPENPPVNPPQNSTENPPENPPVNPPQNSTENPPSLNPPVKLPKNPKGGQSLGGSITKNTVCATEDTKRDKISIGSLTLKVVGNLDRSSQVNMFRIWPSPYTSRDSLVLSDNDNRFDCDQRMNVLSLDHVPFKEYKINAIDQLNGGSLVNFNFSINQDLADPIIDIVKRDLGTPLPIRLVPDQHLLILTTSVTDPGQVAADINSRFKAKILKIYGGGINGILVGVPDAKILDEIMKDPRIAYREQDKIGRIASGERQVLPEGIDRIGGDLYRPASNVLANNLVLSEIGRNHTFSSDVNVDVAILDTGISLDHSDLNVYKNVSFVNYTTLGNDDNGHGSHVAGIVAAKNNSFGVIGVAPGARLWAVKVCDKEGSCTTSNQIKGVEYVINHADEIDVANISIENLYSPALNSAIKRAVLKGVTFVVSAGNSHQNASNISPANSPYAITVSAMADTDGMCGGYGPGTEFGGDDSFANFSNFGKVVDISAPGVDILSTYNGTDYGLDSGTSMAAPHVTGIVALLKANYPNLSPSQVYDMLKGSGSKPNVKCDKDLGGYFIGDVDNPPEPMLQIPQNLTRNNSLS
jgi:hypothetical protein